MARGWESKNIEEQQAERARGERPAAQATPEEAERARRRQTLRLARARAVADREAARTDAHRAMLDRMIVHLDSLLDT